MFKNKNMKPPKTEIIQEDDDDWNPNVNSKTLFDKVYVDMSDQVIKRTIAREDFLHENERKTYGDMTVEGIIKENKAKFEGDEMLEEDDEEDIPTDVKDAVKKQKLFDENLYDPLKDEKYETWVEKHLRVDKSSVIVLSCPFCFTQVSYDSQRHELYENQYRSMFVRNCKVDFTKTLQPLSEGSQNRGKNTKEIEHKLQELKKQDILEKTEETEDNLTFDKDFEKVFPKGFEYFFPVMCSNCDTEIGVYDVEAKVHHFFNTIPSLG